MDFSIPERLLESFIVLVGILLAATLFIWIKKFPPKQERELKERMKTWWLIFVFVAATLCLPSPFSIGLFGVLSFLALREYFSLIPTRPSDRKVLIWAYLSIPVQFYLIHMKWYGMFIIFIPVYMFLLLHVRMIMVGETKDFLKAVSTINWGLTIAVFSLSHMAYLRVLETTQPLPAGTSGLILFLILITEFNDVFQYICGKSFGKRKITPTVSPSKTWGGFLGGLVLTTLCSFLIAPFLTPVQGWMAVALGAIMAVAGFFGDTTVSAVKRDLQIKDSGNLLPGHGGLLDRLDSLCFTTLLFFHFIRYFYT